MKTVLHVGCGPYDPKKLHSTFRSHDWREVRLDINEAVAPDILASLTDMSAIESASMDAVWSSHNVEHLYAHEVPVALREFRRVLKADGFALITLPDLQKIAEWVAQDKLEDVAYHSRAGAIAPIDMIYGHRDSIARGNVFMAHKTGFTAKTLGNALIKAGFARAKVKRGQNFDLWAIAYKTIPSSEIA